MQNIVGKGVKIKDKMDKLYTIGEVCEILKLSRATVDRYKNNGALRAIKFPVRGKGKNGPVRFDEKDLEKFKRNCRLAPVAF